MNNDFIVCVRENTWMSFTQHGWGNGYVILPKTSKLANIGYDELNEKIDVHGGLTYSEEVCEKDLEDFNLPESNLGDWIVGFDTAHFGDNQDKWTYENVLEETERLKRQLLVLDEEKSSSFKVLLEYSGYLTKATFSDGGVCAEPDDILSEVVCDDNLFLTISSYNENTPRNYSGDKLDNHPLLKSIIDSGKKIKLTLSIED
jgi:hypothetical protein